MRILGHETPLEISAAAPFHVRLAAVACVYAIEELAFSTQLDDGSDSTRSVDRVITEQHALLESEGWKLLGIVELRNGSRGWKLVAKYPAVQVAEGETIQLPADGRGTADVSARRAA